jgi:hypothetical protein
MKFIDIEFNFFHSKPFLKTDTSFWRIFYNNSHVWWDTLHPVCWTFIEQGALVINAGNATYAIPIMT